MEDAFHGCLDGIVVSIDRFWVVCSALRPQWLSGSEQGLMALSRRTRRAVIALRRSGAARSGGVADPADDVFARSFFRS